MADLAYDAIVETGVDIHTVPISLDEWEIRAIMRDGVRRLI